VPKPHLTYITQLRVVYGAAVLLAGFDHKSDTQIVTCEFGRFEEFSNFDVFVVFFFFRGHFRFARTQIPIPFTADVSLEKSESMRHRNEKREERKNGLQKSVRERERSLSVSDNDERKEEGEMHAFSSEEKKGCCFFVVVFDKKQRGGILKHREKSMSEDIKTSGCGGGAAHTPPKTRFVSIRMTIHLKHSFIIFFFCVYAPQMKMNSCRKMRGGI